MSERILGVEGGGTQTSWVLVEHEGDAFGVLDQGKLPPSNFRLTTPEQKAHAQKRMQGWINDFNALAVGK